MSAQDQDGFRASFARLYRAMPARRRRQFYLVLALMVLGAIAELATIGAVLPFLTLLADPGSWTRFPWISQVGDLLGAGPGDRLMVATGLFVLLAIVAAAVRLQLVWWSHDFVFKLGHDLAVEVQRRILLQPYSFHIRQNTSTLIASLQKIEVLVFDILLPLMQAGTAIFIASFIIAALIYVDPFTAFVSAAAFSIIYLLISAVTQPRLERNSAVVGSSYDERVKIFQEALGGIRDVIIDGSQAIFVETFRRVDRRLSDVRANTTFIAAAPRFLIEAFGMVLIALLANLLAGREGGLAGAIPILGALALGAQRLLPLLQQVYTGWTSASGHRSVLDQVLDLLSLPVSADEPARADVEPLPLRDRIKVEQVSFSYSGRRARAIREISFEIPRGSTVGLIGRTGSGKSTLADLLMGLLEPTHGRITVDGVPIAGETRQRWWQSIAHVPQSIFLADDSIARNIAFGVPAEAVDMARVVEAATKAQLHDFVAALPEGYDTEVGERGIRLSGGQRQRLGIARAIYKQAPVLVLDEATSALDDATETAVMEAIAALGNEGQTIIIIAHRLTTVARCGIVARLDEGRLVALGSYADVVDGAAGRAFGG